MTIRNGRRKKIKNNPKERETAFFDLRGILVQKFFNGIILIAAGKPNINLLCGNKAEAGEKRASAGCRMILKNNMLFITGNRDKVRELEDILGQKLETSNLDLPEIQAIDPEEVATYKAQNAYNLLDKPVLVEDTGLAFAEMKGLPGALIKFFLLLPLKQITGMIKENRVATGKTVLAYCDSNGVRLFAGETKGIIAREPKGEMGFGWDAIFIPDGSTKTFAEMNLMEKNAFSMRYKAAEKLRAFLK
jgi:XTP/dITP diphosphohydrolase